MGCRFGKLLIHGKLPSVEISGGASDKLAISGKCDNLSFSGGIYNELTISGHYDQISINGGTFNKEISFESIYCKKKIEIIGKRTHEHKTGHGLNDNYTWPGADIRHDIIFKKGIFIGGSICISRINAKNLQIQGSQNDESFDFINELFVTDFSNNVLIDYPSKPLQLNCILINDAALSKECFYNIDNVRVSQLSFNNFINFGSIFIKKLTSTAFCKVYEPENVSYNDTEQESNHFSKLVLGERKPTLSIKSSDLGKATLINSNLRLFIFKLDSSKITDLFLAGSSMPEKICLKKESDLVQARLGYAQLKKVFENIGDTVTAKEYFAKEMNAYHNQLFPVIFRVKKLGKEIRLIWLQLDRRPKKTLKCIFWQQNKTTKATSSRNKINAAEYVSITLNKFSNNHGQSWGRALLWIAIVGSYLFTQYCKALGFEYYPGGAALLKDILCYFPDFINPIHKSDFMTNLTKLDSIPARAALYDSCSRVIMAYLIYQFVQAFRKHGK